MHLWSRLTYNWSCLVFGENVRALTPKVRSLRLLEEVLELAQAENVTAGEVQTILRQVFDKPKGEYYKELGGVLITAAVYAASRNLDLDDIFEQEFCRIMDPKVMERVRTRNLSGDKIGFNL